MVVSAKYAHSIVRVRATFATRFTLRSRENGGRSGHNQLFWLEIPLVEARVSVQQRV